MRTTLIGAVLLIVGVLATPFASAAADDGTDGGTDGGGTPADAVILAARQEVTSFATALSAGDDLRAQADTTSAALREVLAVPVSYPCPHDAETCREKASAATTASQAVNADIRALVEPDPDPALAARYDADAAAFNAAWDEFRIAYREAVAAADSGLGPEATWLITAAAIAVCIALTVALRAWVRRGADDRLVASRKAVYGAAQFLTFALIGVTVVMVVIEGFDAPLQGRSGGKAVLLVLLVPVAAIFLVVATVRYLLARAKVRRATVG